MTGIAYWSSLDNSSVITQLHWQEAASWFHTMLATSDGSDEIEVVSESFLITAATLRKSRETWSLEFIGVLRYLTRAYLGQEVIMYSPAAAKSFSKDEKLKAVGLYRPGHDHGNDAARHLLLHLVNRKLIDVGLLVGSEKDERI